MDMEMKKEFNAFNSYDYMGAQDHLEKMAAKGWMFKSAGAFCWKYEKCEPKRVKFYCSYRDGQETEGWTFADTWGEARIYYSEDENAKPIYDREEDRIEDLRRAVGSSLKSQVPTMVIILMVGYINVFSDIFNKPLEVLSSYGKMLEAVLFLTLIISFCIRAVKTLVWRSRAGRGIILRPDRQKYRWMHVAYIIILIMMFICLIVLIIMEESGDGLGLVIGAVVIIGGMISLTDIFFKELKESGSKAGAKVLLIVLSAVVTICVLFGFITIFVGLGGADDEPDIPEYALSYQDITGSLPGETYDVTYKETETIFLKRIYLKEYDEEYDFEYSIAEVKNKEQYSWFLKKALTVPAYPLFDFIFGDEEPDPEWKEQKDSGWGVDKVYRLADSETGDFKYKEWTLAKENRIIYLELDFEPTDSQKTEIVRKLEETLE